MILESVIYNVVERQMNQIAFRDTGLLYVLILSL